MIKSRILKSTVPIIVCSVIVGMAAVVSAQAAADGEKSIGGFSVRSNGVIDLGDVYLEINHYDSSWEIAQQHDKFTKSPTTAPAGLEGEQFEGTLDTARGPAKIVERVAKAADGIHYTATFASETAIESNELGLAVILPLASFGGKQMKVDDQPVELPQAAAAKGSAVLFSKEHVKQLSVVTPKGLLTFTGSFGVKLNDDREWNDDRYSLRLLFTPSEGAIKTSMIELDAKLTPADK